MKKINNFGTQCASGSVPKEKNLTIIEIIDAFTFYGLDIIILAAATCATVQILKLTLLKNFKRKIVTFLPFTVGVLFYAVYASVKNLDLYFVLHEYVSVLEHGFSVGALSTLLYVLYEQFVREKSVTNAKAGVISKLIEGYVPSGRVEKAAESIAEAIEKDVTGNGAQKIAGILAENADGNISENDIKLLSKLIIETLAGVKL